MPGFHHGREETYDDERVQKMAYLCRLFGPQLRACMHHKVAMGGNPHLRSHVEILSLMEIMSRTHYEAVHGMFGVLESALVGDAAQIKHARLPASLNCSSTVRQI